VEDDSDAAVIAASFAAPARFGTIFDRHATVLHRYLVRRIGRDEADSLVGEVFRIAFEKRAGYDLDRPLARPWLYGIATNLLAKERRSEARRLRALSRLAARDAAVPAYDLADEVSTAADAALRWQMVATAVAALPAAERDALTLHVWEGLPYEQVADALDVPVGTVRSRLNRARRHLRELTEPVGRQQDDYAAKNHPGDPALFARAKEQFMSEIDQERAPVAVFETPDIYPRLAYLDELAAVEYLTRVFQFEEIREARMEFDGQYLCWLRVGTGVVMLGHENADIHRIHSPKDVGLTTVMMNVRVDGVDAHYAHAMAEGADITMEINDAYYGSRRYEATDLEGHRWHFEEPLAAIEARG
jgi:RNA polymerase sigma-70 factor (ECF subfamily)